MREGDSLNLNLYEFSYIKKETKIINKMLKVKI